MSDDREGFGLAVLVIFIVIIGVGLYGKFRPTAEGLHEEVVETRSEHLVFEDEGCRIFQVRIEDRDGLRHIYVAVPHPDKHGRYTTPYARCQVTAH